MNHQCNRLHDRVSPRFFKLFRVRNGLPIRPTCGRQGAHDQPGAAPGSDAGRWSHAAHALGTMAEAPAGRVSERQKAHPLLPAKNRSRSGRLPASNGPPRSSRSDRPTLGVRRFRFVGFCCAGSRAQDLPRGQRVADRVCYWVLSRTTSWAGSTMVRLGCPAMAPSNKLTRAFPASTVGWRTELSDGCRCAASAMSS